MIPLFSFPFRDQIERRKCFAGARAAISNFIHCNPLELAHRKMRPATTTKGTIIGAVVASY